LVKACALQPYMSEYSALEDWFDSMSEFRLWNQRKRLVAWKRMLECVISKSRPSWPEDPVRMGNLNEIMVENLDLCGRDNYLRLQHLLYHELDFPVVFTQSFSVEPIMWDEGNIIMDTVLDLDAEKGRIALSGYSRKDNVGVFVKIQNQNDTVNQHIQYFCDVGIENEITMLEFLRDVPFTPQLLSYGVESQHKYIVVEKLGPSLCYLNKKLRFYNCESMVIKTFKFYAKCHDVYYAAEQLISRLQSLHVLGVLHKDIKPGNICFGIGSMSDHVYLVDYETCWHPSYPGPHFFFTPYYSSPFVTDHVYGARDELISLGFVMMSFFVVLPWYDMDDVMTRTQRKCFDENDVCKLRNELKKSMFARVRGSGKLRFVGDVLIYYNGRRVSYRDVLMKASEALYNSFVLYFDKIFNDEPVGQFIFLFNNLTHIVVCRA
jgi:hypothetical protein